MLCAAVAVATMEYEVRRYGQGNRKGTQDCDIGEGYDGTSVCLVVLQFK